MRFTAMGNGEAKLLRNRLKELEKMLQAQDVELIIEKNKNQALIESLDSSGIGYCILQAADEKEGILAEANNEFAKMIGYPKKEIIGKSYREILHPASQSLIYGRFRKRKMGKKVPAQYQLLANREDGSIATLEVSEGIITYKRKVAIILFARDITTRKKLEYSLIKDKEFFEKLIDNAADAIVSSDEENKIVEWNKAAERIFGYSKEETIGKNIDDLIAKGEKHIEAISLSHSVAEGKKIHAFETTRYRKDSTLVQVSLSGAPIIIANRYKGKITIYRDITKLKEMTEELRKSEAKFRNLFENASDAIFTIDAEGNFTSGNKMAEKVCGYSRKELIGKSFRVLACDEDIKKALFSWNKIKIKHPHSIELRIKRKDGEIRTLSIHISPITIKGKITGMQGVARDITERKKLEIKLKESEEKFKAIFENANDCIVILDKEGYISLANSKFFEISGYKEELENINIYQCIHPNDRELLKSHLNKAISGELNPQRFEVKGLRKDGSIRYLDINTNVIKKADEIIGIQAIMRDITERKSLAERLKQNYKNLVTTIASFIEIKDLYTEEHSKRIVEDSIYLARQLDMNDEEIKDIEIAALLHDLGKVKISGKVLNKKGKFNKQEWEIMKKHSQYGEEGIKNMPEFRNAGKIIRHHHERYDGKGYPDGLKGEKIPLGARIIALVDAFDAMLSNRPYRKALSFEEAKTELIREKGKQFDPYITDIYMQYLEASYEDFNIC